MSPVLKFWIASTLVLFLLVLWPLNRQLPESSGTTENELAKEARLVDHFCLSKAPIGGKATIPQSWEDVLNANIRVCDAAGEAAADIGLPREQSNKISTLRPGSGMFHEDQRGAHYVMKSAQGSDWFVVLSRKPAGGVFVPRSSNGALPSPLAMAIALALVGGGLMTLLARVAFGKLTATK